MSRETYKALHTVRPGIHRALFEVSSVAHASGAGTEWNTLNQEVTELNPADEYDRAIIGRDNIWG